MKMMLSKKTLQLTFEQRHENKSCSAIKRNIIDLPPTPTPKKIVNDVIVRKIKQARQYLVGLYLLKVMLDFAF